MKHPICRTAALALLASCVVPAGAWAQEPARPVADAAPAATPESEPAARLLSLADGRVLRVRARRAGESWEILQGKDLWQALAPGTVVRATLERDALAEARRLEAQVAAVPRKDQPAQRAALADWLLRQGLAVEGLAQLDRVLAADPDHPQALGVAASAAPKLSFAALDAALSGDAPTLDVLRFAAHATPSVRELAVLELGAGGADDLLRAELRAQLASHSPRLRSVAALALRRLYPGRALRIDDVRELINRSVLDGADEVRLEAARALRGVGDPGVTAPALRALTSKNPRLRENSIAALGVMGYRESVEPLMTYLSSVNTAVQAGRTSAAASSYLFVGTQTAYVQDFDVEVANSSAIADPQVNTLIEGAMLDARVLGSYTISFATETRLVRQALVDLTGLDVGGTNRAWFDWWAAHKSDWTAPLSKDGATTVAPEAPKSQPISKAAR